MHRGNKGLFLPVVLSKKSKPFRSYVNMAAADKDAMFETKKPLIVLPLVC